MMNEQKTGWPEKPAGPSTGDRPLPAPSSDGASTADKPPARPNVGSTKPEGFDAEALFQTPDGCLVLDPTDSWRPLDAHWQIAVRLSRGERLPLEYRTPPDVVSARTAIRELKSYDPALALAAMNRRYPHAAGVIALRLHPRPALRWELEARVLAGQTPREIGARLGYPAGAIELYESWFYCARPYLAAGGWVRHRAIRTYDPTVDPTEELLKHYGYIGGPLVLDRFLAVMLGTSQNPNGTAADLNRYFHDESREILLIKAAIAMHLLEVNPSNVVQFAKHWVRGELKDRRRAAKDPGIDPVAYAPNIAEMLRGLPWLQEGRDRTDGGVVGELLESLNPAHAREE